ncbi:transcriptional regulator, Sir2 domain protein, partial [Leptospira kirschneri str. 200801925]
MKEFIAKHKNKLQKISAISGAGISAESGIPTFRGKEGL